MDKTFYIKLTEAGVVKEPFSVEQCREILLSSDVELLPLLDSAYQVRKKFHGNTVEIHIINNIQNGLCPEDCHYCAQARTSKADIDDYPLKSDEEIFAEAKSAYEKGAFRYCMVSSGRGPSEKRVEKLVWLIKEIKRQYPIQVCVSAGLMDEKATQKLKDAGLDRLNHNLNTSQSRYPEICTTHTFEDRLKTLTSARNVGLEICSGIIAGMGETPDDVIEVALQLRRLNARSIPINFLIPIDGNVLQIPQGLTPQYCLRMLCLFRFLNPDAEIRMAAGREGHLRSLEVMGLYPANSLFLQGYLNTKGSTNSKTLQMIKDAGFSISSDHSLDELLCQETKPDGAFQVEGQPEYMKGIDELRPQLHTQPRP